MIPGHIVDAMWDVFTTGKTNDFRAVTRNDEALAVLDVSEVEGGPFVGPPARYFTVQYEARGRTHYMHLQAVDGGGAVGGVMERRPSTSHAEFVRELSREEFERLARVPS